MILLLVEESGVHHGEGPVGGEKAMDLLEAEAGEDEEPRGPHKQASCQRHPGEGGEEGGILARHHHRRAPRLTPDLWQYRCMNENA